MIDNIYFRQAELLLRVLPMVDREAVFALKGGTVPNACGKRAVRG